MESYKPQPYAAARLNLDLFFSNREEIFSACYDEFNNVLYVTEFCHEMEGRLIVHAFKVNYVEAPVAVEDNCQLPDEFKLYQCYPSPFNPTTKIKYTIPYNVVDKKFSSTTTAVTLKVYNVLGAEVVVLVNEHKYLGDYDVEFNANGLPSGLYVHRLKSDSYSAANKLIIKG